MENAELLHSIWENWEEGNNRCAPAPSFCPLRTMPRIPTLKNLEDLVTEYHGNFSVRMLS